MRKFGSVLAAFACLLSTKGDPAKKPVIERPRKDPGKPPGIKNP